MLLLKCALLPYDEQHYSISDVNLVFIQIPLYAGYWGLLQKDVYEDELPMFNDNGTCVNL